MDTFTRAVILTVLCGLLILNCQSGPPETTAAPAVTTGVESTAIPSVVHQADSLLELMGQRLKRRQLGGLDTLIEKTAALYTAMDSTATADSLRWGGYFKVQAYKSSYLRQLGQFDDCLALCDRMIPRARNRLGADNAVLALFYNVKSASFLLQGALDSCKIYAERAINLLDEQPVRNKGTLMAAHMRLGRAGFQAFDFMGAMAHTNSAITYARQSGDEGIDSVALGAAYNMRAGMHYSFQEYEQTVEYLDKAYQLTAANPFWEATYKMNIAGVLAEVGNTEEALALNREARRVLQTVKPAPQENVSIVKYNFGILYMDSEAYDSAAVYLEEMLEWRKVNLPQQGLLIATNQNSLAYVYTRQNRLAAANVLFDQSQRFYRRNLPAYHPEWSRYDLLRAMCYEAGGDHTGALNVAQHALNCALLTPGPHPAAYNPDLDEILLKDHALKAYVQKCASQLALANQTGDNAWLDRCLETVSHAIELLDRMRADYQLARFRRLLNQHARQVYTTGIKAAIARYQKQGDSADLESAFEFSTRSKGGMLRDIQRELNARQFADIPDSLRRAEERLQTRIWRTEVTFNLLQSGGGGAQQEQTSALKDTLHNLWTRYGKFKRQMQQTYPAYRALMYTAPAFSIEQLRRRALDEQTVIVDVFNGEEALHFFVVRDDTIDVRSVPLTAELDSILLAVRENLVAGESDYERFCENAYQLYRRSLQPFEPLIEDRHIIFIPDRALYATPVAALLTEQADTNGVKSYADLPYLIRRNAVRYTYSASQLLAGADSSNSLPPANSFIAYAPGFMDGLPADTVIARAMMAANSRLRNSPISGALPFSETEVTQIRDYFLARDGGMPLWLSRWLNRTTRLRLNRQATETALLAEDLGQFRYVHFSTHGFFYRQPAPLAGLLLYRDAQNDGIILPGDIYRLKLNADLVVLSACQTALGEWAQGEGLIGPAQAFLQAGANNLLVTLWQTENRSAMDMMLRFYEEMLAGERKDAALRTAQLAMLETEDFRHPRYWAPYILIGK